MEVTPLRAGLWLAVLTRKAVLARTTLSKVALLMATLSWGWRCAVQGSVVGSDTIGGSALVGNAN